jgi:hypothetical protein
VLGLVRLARVVRDGACWRGVARATSEWIEVFTVTAFQFSSEHLVQLDGTPYVPPADDLLTADAPAWMWEENALRGDAP